MLVLVTVTKACDWRYSCLDLKTYLVLYNKYMTLKGRQNRSMTFIDVLNTYLEKVYCNTFFAYFKTQ